MTLIWEAASAYELAALVQPERRAVPSDEACQYSRALNRLTRVLGTEAAEPTWEPIIQRARAARWRAGAEAVPFDAPMSGAVEPLRNLPDQLRSLSGLVDREVSRSAQDLADRAEAWLPECNRALSNALLNLIGLGDPHETCVVASNGRSAAVLQEWLASAGVRVSVLKPRDFMRGRFWDFAIVVGATDWFPSQMFTCPRASALTVLHFAHLADSATITGVFGSYASAPIRTVVRGDKCGQPCTGDTALEEDSAREQSPAPQWPTLIADAMARTDRTDVHEDTITARLVVLAGGYGLWLPVDATSIRGLDLSAPRGERVVPLRASAIKSGAVLVLRENGSISATLAAMADHILGASAEGIRQRQREWKSRLGERLRTTGAAAFESDLRRRGASTANVRYWASDDNIRPLRDEDFRILLERLDLSDPGRYLADGRLLWRAHHQAGVRLSAALEDLIESADLRHLEAEGRQQLQLTGVTEEATLTAFRVLAVDEQARDVPHGSTRKPFRLRGAQWLE